MSMMKLHWSPRSPFVRKVMVAAHELGLADRIGTVRTVVAMTKVARELLPDNPLGKLKFTLEGTNGIYLHDTSARHLFGKADRTLSHGCVRLSQPEALAKWLLPDRPFDLENALAPEHAALVLPLVDDDGEDRRMQMAARHGYRVSSPQQSLEALIRQDDAWLRACALYVAGSRRERGLLPLVESNVDQRDTMVRETASWARLAIEAT